MRRETVAEVGGSLMIAAITGLYTVAGLALAAYAFLAFNPSLKTSGLILLLFGIVNLPIFVMWSVETATRSPCGRATCRGVSREFHPLR